MKHRTVIVTVESLDSVSGYHAGCRVRATSPTVAGVSVAATAALMRLAHRFKFRVPDPPDNPEDLALSDAITAARLRDYIEAKRKQS